MGFDAEDAGEPAGRLRGRERACEERRRIGLGSRPLRDAVELLEEQGIRTAMLDLPEEVSGLTLMERGLSLSIVLNRRHHRSRRRFSWIHEYAHVLLDRSQRGTISLESRTRLVLVDANVLINLAVVDRLDLLGSLFDLEELERRRFRMKFESFREIL